MNRPVTPAAVGLPKGIASMLHQSTSSHGVMEEKGAYRGRGSARRNCRLRIVAGEKTPLPPAIATGPSSANLCLPCALPHQAGAVGLSWQAVLHNRTFSLMMCAFFLV